VKLITDAHVVSRLRITGAVTPPQHVLHLFQRKRRNVSKCHVFKLLSGGETCTVPVCADSATVLVTFSCITNAGKAAATSNSGCGGATGN
jgi:hypothetical protein